MPFEWYQTYKSLSPFMTTHILDPSKSATNLRNTEDQRKPMACKAFPSKDICKVLIVGCGSSRFGEDMMKDGWTGGITNVDYSEVVIEKMKKRYNDNFYRKVQAKLNREKREDQIQNDKENSDDKAKVSPAMSKGKKKVDRLPPIPKMEFECVDITDSLPYADASFDLIINKGTMDSILCSNGAATNIRTMMRECSRVLKDHGSMIVVSHGKADDRLVYFENDDKWWSGGLNIFKVKKPNVGALVAATGCNHHYIYVASRGG